LIGLQLIVERIKEMPDYGIGIRDPLWFVGVIANTVDPRKEGRVQVRAFGIHGTNKDIPDDELPWAVLVSGAYDANVFHGAKTNKWVFGLFLDGRHAQQPMIIGTIPTQNLDGIDPEKNGWGTIPPKDAHLLAKGSEPESIGQHDVSKLARGEYLHETNLVEWEMGRALNVKVADSDETWDEPAPAYDTEYPHNKVIESGVHTIELDDTPGSERITVWHKEGSYVQIDSRGTVTEKSTSDKYEVIDRKQHVLVGNASTVTINGDAHVYVKGHKVEEIQGDLKQIVHGNYYLGVGGPETIINGSENLQMRAGQVKVEANAGYMSFLSKKETQIEAGQGIGIQAPKIFGTASEEMLWHSDKLFAMDSAEDFKIKGADVRFQGTDSFDLKGDAELRVSSDGYVMVRGTTTFIDDFVRMAEGSADPARDAQDVTRPGGMDTKAQPVKAPEPPEKGVNLQTNKDTGSRGSAGASSPDHSGETVSTTETLASTAPATAAMQSSLTPLLNLIGRFEGDQDGGYNAISGLIDRALHPSRPITTMTIGQVLQYQESVDSVSGSEAMGRYQIMEDTLRGYDNDDNDPPPPGDPLYARAGLSLSDKFSPINQDKMAVELLRRRGLDGYLSGNISRTTFANNLAAEWASLPIVNGPKAGQSRYSKPIYADGKLVKNNAKITVGEFEKVLDEIKGNYEKASTTITSKPETGGSYDV